MSECSVIAMLWICTEHWKKHMKYEDKQFLSTYMVGKEWKLVLLCASTVMCILQLNVMADSQQTCQPYQKIVCIPVVAFITIFDIVYVHKHWCDFNCFCCVFYSSLIEINIFIFTCGDTTNYVWSVGGNCDCAPICGQNLRELAFLGMLKSSHHFGLWRRGAD